MGLASFYIGSPSLSQPSFTRAWDRLCLEDIWTLFRENAQHCFPCILIERRVMYKSKNGQTPHHTTQTTLGSRGAAGKGHGIQRMTMNGLHLYRVKQGGHGGLSIVEDGRVAMLLDPPDR